MSESIWWFVKKRTAADGAVYISVGRTRYRRTGGPELQAEAAFQRRIADLDYPVPHILEEGFTDDGHYYVVEESLGDQTLHDQAVASLDGGRALADDVTGTAAQVAARLLRAPAAHLVEPPPGALRQWLESAGFTQNVFQENPGLDTPRTRAVLDHALDRLATVPLVLRPAQCLAGRGHRLAAPRPGPPRIRRPPGPGDHRFQGRQQGLHRQPRPAAPLPDRTGRHEPDHNRAVSQHLGVYLLVKALFFLALMRPTDSSRTDKHLKWQYRRHLFTKGLEQYEHTGTVDTALFPGLEEFAAGHHAGNHP